MDLPLVSVSGTLLGPQLGARWEGSPTKIDCREKSGSPYSNLSTGGPSLGFVRNWDSFRAFGIGTCRCKPQMGRVVASGFPSKPPRSGVKMQFLLNQIRGYPDYDPQPPVEV